MCYTICLFFTQVQDGSFNRMLQSAMRNRLSVDEDDDHDDEATVPALSPDASASCHRWRLPSARTVDVVREMLANLIDKQHRALNLAMVETTLTLCSPEEDILKVCINLFRANPASLFKSFLIFAV